MKLEWTRLALKDFDKAQDYIAQDNPIAAQAVARRIAEAAHRLVSHPELGRLGRVADTRELVVSRTPYLLVYRVGEGRVDILRVWHGRRDWSSAL